LNRIGHGALLLGTEQAGWFDQKNNRHDDKDNGCGRLRIKHFGQALNKTKSKTSDDCAHDPTRMGNFK
jgi:hypothetical protein